MNLHVPSTRAGRRMAANTRLGHVVLPLDGLDVDDSVNGLFTMRASFHSRAAVLLSTRFG